MNGQRVKVTGDLFHGRVPNGAVYIGRGKPGIDGSPWANPHSVKRHGLPEALRLFRLHLRANPGLVDRARVELAGQTLACWCHLDQDCHGDIWLAVITGEAP
jgi:hypothetical protein